MKRVYTSANLDKTPYLPKRLKLHDFMVARNRIAPYIQHTPLRHSKFLSRLSGADVWLKLESLQPTGSFKVRGALNKLMILSEAEKSKGVVTASAGNHGLGLAYAGETLGFAGVTIFIPQTAPKAKVEKLQRYTVTLHQTGQSYEEAHQAAESFATQTGAQYLSAYDDVDVVMGQGTCGLEILLDLPRADVILVPTGGGGLLSGIALVAKAINPLIKIIGVQPEASPSAKLSLEQRRPLDPYDHEPTIADGLAGGFGAIPFYLASTLVEQILLYSEADIRQAVFTLVHQEQLIVEASGAIAIAPLWQNPALFEGQTVVCVLTGANIDAALLYEILHYHCR
jgi:threonine dehydratase